MTGIYNREMVFNRLLGNGWSDLDDFLAAPHETEEMVKISHMARVRAHARNFCIMILAKM